MGDLILSLLFDFIVPLGPAAYVLFRWNGSPEKISNDMVRVVLAWTMLMLFFKIANFGEARSDLRTVCRAFETHLTRETGDGDAAYEAVGSQCHPEDYEPIERD